jgi:hypothetical protein
MAKSVLEIIYKIAKQGNADRETLASIKQLEAGFKQFTAVAAGVAAAGVALNQVYQQTVKVFVDYAAQVRDLSRVTGMGAQETSKLIQAADDLTISYESLQKALWAASKQGIDVSIDSLAALADEYTAIQAPAERAEFLAKNFGKSGAEMGKLLQEGGAGVRAYTDAISGSLVLTDQAVQKAREHEMAMDELNDTFLALKVSAGSDIVGPLTAGMQELNNQIREEGILGFGTADALQVLIAAMKEAGITAKGVITFGTLDAWRMLIEHIRDAMGETGGFGQAAALSGQATLDAAAANMELAESFDEVSSANQDFLGLVMQMQSETDNFNQKSTDLNTTLTDLYAQQEKLPTWSAKYKELQGKIDETKGAIEANAAAHEDASRRIAFSLLQQQAAVGGLTDTKLKNLLKIGQQWGILDAQTVIATESMIAQNELLAMSFDDPIMQGKTLYEKLQILAAKDGKSWTYYFNMVTIGSMPSLPAVGAANGYSGGNKTCFAASTLVSMADGSAKSIADVSVGERVVSFDLTTQQKIVTTVVKIFAHSPDEVRGLLRINNETIVTADHLLYDGNAWRAAGDFRVGEQIQTIDGYVTVESIERNIQPEPVYNLHVDHDCHNYFANGLLAHNAKMDNAAEGGWLGGNWTLVGDRRGGGFVKGLSELISPSGYVFDSATSERLLASGVIGSVTSRAEAGDVYNSGGTTTSGGGGPSLPDHIPTVPGRDRVGGSGGNSGSNNLPPDVVQNEIANASASVEAATTAATTAAQSAASAQNQTVIMANQIASTIEAGNAEMVAQQKETNRILSNQEQTISNAVVAGLIQANP